MNRILKKYQIFMVFLFAFHVFANGQVVRYVTTSGAGSGNGTNWDNAYSGNQLQTAIDEADVTEIWIAEGTYKPGTLRTDAFRMKNGVTLYGGFTGDETLLSERNWSTHVTILSGDINDDDEVTGSGAFLSITPNTENCYHVIYNPDGIDATAVLNGITIKGGYADDEFGADCKGGGIYNINSSPSLINCTILGNYSWTAGGGISNEALSSPALINCLIINNLSDYYGGGIYNYDHSSPSLINCNITGNYSLVVGGGIYCENASSPIIQNSIIWYNVVVEGEGHQFYIMDGTTTLDHSCYSNGDLDVTNYGTFEVTNHNTTFNPQFADAGAGDYRIYANSPCADAGDDTYNSLTTDIRCTGFGRKLDKTTGGAGTIDIGAYECKNGTDPSPLIRYVIPAGAGSGDGTSWDNAYAGTQLQTAINELGVTQVWVAAGTYKPSTTSDTLISFQMKNHVAIYGGFEGGETSVEERNWSTHVTKLSGDLNDDDVVTGSSISLSITGYIGNSIHVVYNPGDIFAAAVLDGFTITGGNANDEFGELAGGGVCNINSSPTISNCIITGNFAMWIGGGIYNSGSSPIVTNCTISRNKVQDGFGGGISNDYLSSPTFVNCLIIGNSTDIDGGGISNENSALTLTNCTVSGNYAVRTGGGMEMSGDAESPMSITMNNSILWGNNIDGRSGRGRQANLWAGILTLNNSCYSYDQNYQIDSCDIYVDPGGRDDRLLTIDGNSITTDPLFTNAEAGDYRIFDTSPCVDAGQDSYNSQATDIRGTGFGRKLDKSTGGVGTIDMGSYEFKTGTDPIQVTRYVTPAGAGSANGTSWGDAYAGSQLQTAINEATVTQVWVAVGTYLPTEDLDGVESPADGRTKTFRMKNGVSIYGGFAGTETLLSERNWLVNVSILSGDLSGNDLITGSGTTLTFTGNTENCYHVINNQSVIRQTAVLDGFTIKGGNANVLANINNGGGVLNVESSPTLNNCTITGNYAANSGGGLYNSTTSPSSPALNNCTISRNYAVSGGGVYNNSSSPRLIRCTISGNLGRDAGGGIDNESSSTASLVNCLIINNSTEGTGGGVCNGNSSPTLATCTISGNYSATSGGGLANSGELSELTVNNSIIWGNSIDEAAGFGRQIYLYGGSVVLNRTCYSNNQTGVFDNYNDESADPLGTLMTEWRDDITEDPKFADPVAGDFRIFNTSPCADAGWNYYNHQTTDIRGTGFGRELNKTTGGEGTVDMGAYEYNEGTDLIPVVRYVTTAGSGAADGTTWGNAYSGTQLQTAINEADVTEVWVAEGTYKPGTLRTDAFRMKSGVAIYGGFGGTEVSKSERNWTTHATILSGDLGEADVVSGSGATLSITNNTDNCYHVIYNPDGIGITAVLDGFTIKGGSANGVAADYDGGGILNTNSSPMLANCTISGNYASSSGGGMANETSSSPTLINCLILNNLNDFYGGGIFNYDHSSPSLINCNITGNKTTGFGGGMYCENGSIPTINNSIIWGNVVTTEAGNQIYLMDGTTTLNHSCYSNGDNDVVPNAGTIEATNHNTTADPQFSDAGEGDYRIFSTSPSADAGDDTYTSLTTDIRGTGFDRKLNKASGGVGTIDMGAFEYKSGTDPSFLTLDVKVFLEGPFDSGTELMETTLNTNDLIPLDQPYNTAPWNYAGTETVASIPADVVDWVLVELRDAATPEEALPATKIEGWPKAFFLKKDGSLVDTDGTSLPNIGNPVIAGHLYAVIRHRNHIAIMSADGLTLTGSVYSYDFSSAITQAYNGDLGYKEIVSGVFAMVTGDINADGSVYASDFTFWASSFGTTDAYHNSDLNFDGSIYSSDFTQWAINFGTTNPISKSPDPGLPVDQGKANYSSQVPETIIIK